MQILGGLLNLSDRGDDLPLPWWYRGPLGLKHGVDVYVSLTAPKKRSVGDLVVSVLEPSSWTDMVVVEGSEADEPGVLAKTFAAMQPLNVLLAEAVTVETGDTHNVTVICGPYGGRKVSAKGVKANLKAKKLGRLKSRPFIKAAVASKWADVAAVEHGWLRQLAWRKNLLAKFPSAEEHVDLRRVVVSADTEKRILRFIFPKRGAFTLGVAHADKPGALQRICEQIKELDLNILSALLRRGTKGHTNELVAICEPAGSASTDTGEETRRTLEARLKGEDMVDFRTQVTTSIGSDPEKLIYPHHPDDSVVRVPEAIETAVRFERKKLAGRNGIFVSRRFLDDPDDRSNRIAQRVRDVLNRNHCVPVEALPEPKQLTTALQEVTSKVWACRAGIVLVSRPALADRALSMSIAHEAGIIQGQSKPLLLLVEDGGDGVLDGWSTMKGLVDSRFARDDSAFDRASPRSIDAVVGEWIREHAGFAAPVQPPTRDEIIGTA